MKTLLLSATSLLFTMAAVAQLTVRPNPSTSVDSYVYASDVQIFVTGAINLEKNAVGATEASIYLRDGAQLFQGTETNTNTGDGHLSVYQQTFGDTWDYTFWSSPVGIADGSTGDTDFGVGRLYNPSGLTSSTQSGTNTGVAGTAPMNISTRWTYKHGPGSVDEPSYERIYARNNVPSGWGFLMRGIGTTNVMQEYDFRGRPHNGTLTIPVETNMYTLSGNPYPSALDLKLMWYDTDNTGEINSIRYWDEDKNVDHYNYSGKLGGFGIWTPGGNLPGTNDNGLYTPAPFTAYTAGGSTGGTLATGGMYLLRRYSPIGQGFMIFGAANANVQIKNSHRIFIKEGVDSEFRNGTIGQDSDVASNDNDVVIYNDDGTINDNPPVVSVVSPMYRINVNFQDTYIRPLLLAFDDNTTDNFDNGWDARSPMGQIAVAEAFFPIADNGEKLPHTINAVNFRNDIRVPLSIILKSQIKFEIKAIEEINIDQIRPGMQAFVHDTATNTYKQISDDESAVYQLPAGDYLDRFYIVFAASRQNLEDESNGVIAQDEIQRSVDFFQNNRASQLEVSNPDGYDITAANIYDLTGKMVVSERNLGNSTRLVFPTGNLSDGVYIVKLMTTDNVAIDYKMTVYNNK